MPVNADPDASIDYTLSTDEKTPDPKPTFKIKFNTQREQARLSRILADAGKILAVEPVDEAAYVCKIEEAISLGVLGWNNVRFRGEIVAPGTPPGEFLSVAELGELAYTLLRATSIGEESRKKSLSPATSTQANSAKPAGASESASND